LFFLNTPPREWYAASPSGSPALEITYLGTAGFVLRDEHRTVVLDPYVSRASLCELLHQRLSPKGALVHALLPTADEVLVGHAHFDHILDAPILCQQTGARLIGARASMMVGRAVGLPESQMIETAGHEEIAAGPWKITGLPSMHGKAFWGRIPLPGDMTAPPSWPPRFYELKHGLVLNWLIDTGAMRVLHIDSADFLRESLQGVQVDVACLCAIGRQYRPNYVREVLALTRPRWVIPCHWDTMITHIGEPPDLLPGVDLPGFLQEISAEGVTPLLMPLLGTLTLPARQSPEASRRQR
jgi:L-ascorbate metabolism protein UlaG (beta-lactamase superfamily)